MLLNYTHPALAPKMDKQAVPAIEYGLIAPAPVVIISPASSLGTNLAATLTKVSPEL